MLTSRLSPTILVITAMLAAIAVLDMIIVREVSFAILYALPMVVAALRLRPRTTAAFAALTILVFALHVALERPLLLPAALRLTTLLVIGGLNILLAMRIRQAERARLAAEQAELALQNFVAMGAHELRRALAASLPNAELLARLAPPSEERQRAQDTIRLETARMERLVEDLSDAARVGARSLGVRPEPMDLVDLVREVVTTRTLGSSQHRLELDAPEQLTGEWDRERLAQVLHNLLDNAAKYSPDGSTISVRVRREDKRVLVSVADQGGGIRREDLPRLFQPFSRLENDQSRPGVGLGLYVARGVVHALGGRIWAESAGPGKGATFTFSLPLRGPVGRAATDDGAAGGR